MVGFVTRGGNNMLKTVRKTSLLQICAIHSQGGLFNYYSEYQFRIVCMICFLCMYYFLWKIARLQYAISEVCRHYLILKCHQGIKHLIIIYKSLRLPQKDKVKALSWGVRNQFRDIAQQTSPLCFVMEITASEPDHLSQADKGHCTTTLNLSSSWNLKHLMI